MRRSQAIFTAVLVLAFFSVAMAAPPGDVISNPLANPIQVSRESAPSHGAAGTPTGTTNISPASGGTVKLGNLTLGIPAGAVETRTIFTVKEAAPGTRPTRGTVRIMGKEYVITATDASGKPVWEFGSPLSLSLPIPLGTDPKDLVISYWDEVLGEWLAVPTRIEGGQLVGTLNHLTVFAALAWPGLTRFADLGGHWAEADVVGLTSLGIVNGYSDGTYRPMNPLTRAEAVKLIVCALKVPTASNVIAVFADKVPTWASPYIGSAMKAGIVKGYEDGTFRAETYVSRAEWVLMLIRAGGWKAEVGASGFVDELPSWARDAIERATVLGLVKG